MYVKVTDILIERGEAGVILLHGFTGSPLSLREFANILAEKDYTVYCPLLPGHGTTPEDLNKVKWVDWVNAVEEAIKKMRELEISNLFIGGISLGGTLTLRIGEIRQDIDGLIPIATPVIMKKLILKFVPVLKWIIKYVKKERRRSQEARNGSYDVWPVRAIHEVLKLMKKTKKELHRITSPILIIHSKKDDLVPFENIDIIYNNVSSKVKKKVILERSSHAVLYEDEREIVYKEVLSFLEKLLKKGQ